MVSSARPRSSSENVASVTSTSAPHAASTIVSVGRRVAGDHDLAAGSRRPEHLIGAYHAPIREGHRLPSLQRAARGAARHAERIGGVDVEAPRSRGFDQRPADGRDTMGDGEGCEAIAVPFEHSARFELDHPQLVRQLSHYALQRPEQVDEPTRAMHLERALTPPEREGLEQPREPEDVVGVEVRHEDLAELDEADRGPQ